MRSNVAGKKSFADAVLRKDLKAVLNMVLSKDAQAVLNAISNYTIPICNVNVQGRTTNRRKSYRFDFHNDSTNFATNDLSLSLKNLELGVPELIRNADHPHKGSFGGKGKVNYYVSFDAIDAIKKVRDNDILSPHAQAFLGAIMNNIPCTTNHWSFVFAFSYSGDSEAITCKTNGLQLSIKNLEIGVPELLEKAGYTQNDTFVREGYDVAYYISSDAMTAIKAKYNIVEASKKSVAICR